ncbi:MAG: DUF4178 domain-containing protein [Nitrospirae bacterium]|nr:DUF4178 domain-containing protein [Nitrospirota bacterium]
MKTNCPSCGAEVRFKSSVSVFSVCDHCRAMIVRRDMDLESLGQMAQLPDDISPLKLGSTGKYRDTRFEVIGRLKVAWSEGFWNEWYLLFENGKNGWLAEAMGFFMMSSEAKVTDRVPGREAVRVGNSYELAPPMKFYVDDIKEAICVGSEGELPFKGMQGRKTVSVDMSSYSGEFVNIEYCVDEIRLYTGRYVEFEELAMSNLRDLSADIKKIRAAELFKCPSCGGPFSMLTPGLTASVACRYCGSTIDATHKTLAVLSKAEKKMKIKPLIPIGSKGRLLGTDWEVTGFMRRSDKTGLYMWDEYLLFNPFKGFRWLTTYNGHWNYVEMLRNSPVRAAAGLSALKFRDRIFKRFLVGQGKVFYVLGEFYWRVRLGETVDVTDYICPPEILSCESDSSEANWSVGRYIGPEEVAGAFGITEGMPPKEGVAPNQPSPYASILRPVMWSFVAFAICLTVLQLYFILALPDRQVYRGDFKINDRKIAKPFITPSFDIPGSTGNISVAVFSPVQNDWLEADIDLVNEETNKNVGFEQGVEYYFGVEDGEGWSEGSQGSTHLLSSVAGGRYHFVIQAGGSGAVAEKSLSIFVRRGVVVWSNIFVALLLLGVYPLYVIWKNNRFELNRWSESDLSPDNTADEVEADEA